MAVQDEISFKRYAANGVATVYAIPFLLLAASDLQVSLDAAPVVGGFTISGLGSNTGQITFDAPPSGDLLLLRVVPFERLSDYQDNGDFLSRTVNLDFDRIWLAIQELRRDDGRTVTISPLEPEGISSLPLRAQRSGRVLAFDLLGNPVPSNLTLAQLEQQPTVAMAAAEAADADAADAANSASSAGSSATAAGDSATLAEKWAEEAEDVPVTTGPNKFSAKHWAAKAAASLSSLSASLTALTARVLNLENAQQVLHVRDVKASGANGGTFTSGAWRTRDLNTVLANTIAGASLSSNQITLPAGTYSVEARAPMYATAGAAIWAAMARLAVVAGSAVAMGSSTGHGGSGAYTFSASEVRGRFTLAAPSVLELQHYITGGSATFGYPVSVPGVSEIYSDVIIRRVS